MPKLKIGVGPFPPAIPSHPEHGDLTPGRVIEDDLIQPDGALYLRVDGEVYASDPPPAPAVAAPSKKAPKPDPAPDADARS